MVSLDSLAFLLTSITSLVLIYLKLPTESFQKVIAALLLILLVIYKRFFSGSIAPNNVSYTDKLFRVGFLGLSASFVQLLVISSGGFYSPFLILLHLYTLGTSFLIRVSSAISFLVLSLVVLLSSTILNKDLLFLFKEDPGTAILYFVSFIVIIPLAQFLMSTYHLKDTISKILTETLAIGERRERSILSGLNELVLITDVNLKILTFNEAVQKSLNLQGPITGENLLSALHLKDESGKSATLESLSIDQAVGNRITYFIKGFELETKFDKHFKVSLQINPITNPAGEVNQISFVITDAKVAEPSTHSTLEQARQRQKIILQNLKTAIEGAQLKSAETQVLLLGKLDEDLLMAQDLEDHPFKKRVSYQDLAELMIMVIAKKEPLAKALQVLLQFILPKEEVKEAAYLSLKKSNLSSQLLPSSDFSVPTDTKWLGILLEKLIDISMLLVLGRPNPAVNLSGIQDNRAVIVSVAATPVQLKQTDKVNLFEKYYGNLADTTNLRFGSGLEGFIAKAVSSELKLPIEVSIQEEVLTMSVKVPKGTH